MLTHLFTPCMWIFAKFLLVEKLCPNTRIHGSISSPYRIVDDCGGAFAMGAIGGGIFSFVKGWRNSPSVR